MIKLNEIDLDKTYQISHLDTDGTIPIVLNKFFQINYAKEVMSNYGEDAENSDLSSGLYNTVIYTDFTPNDRAREIIKEKNMKCLIIDHHESVKESMEEFCKDYLNAEYIFDVNKCGTKLYYEWLLSQGYKGNKVSDYIVELTDTYDLFKKESSLFSEADKLNRLLYSSAKWYILKSNPTDRISAYETFINSMVWKMQNMNEFKFVAWEMEKIQGDINKENEIFESLIKNASKEISTRKDERGKYFCVFSCKSKISAIASRVLEKYKKVDYLLIINDYNQDDPKVSLRSREINLLDLNFTSGHELACGIDSEKVGDMKEFVRKLKNKEIFELGYKEN